MIRPLLLVSCLALAAGTALAQTPGANAPAPSSSAAPAPTAAAPTVPVTLAGDKQRGKMLTYTCQGCHGVEGYRNGYPNYHVPRIGGQSEQYIVSALTEYQQGTRKHPTMQAQARTFSAQDIADIAAFLSSLK